MTRISGRPDISSETVFGQSLRVARWRTDLPGTPLLYLNGVGADIATAAPLLAQISGREVWTLDMPGVGGSPDAFLPYTASAMAATVMTIADRFGHDPIDLAGFSWGGALAQQIAVQYRSRIRRLVLMATTPSLGAPGIGWAAMLDGDILANGLRLPTATPLGLAYQGMALAGWTSVPMLPLLRGLPVLVLMARDDGIVPASHGQMIADLVDEAQIETVPGSHLFPFAHAARTASRISEFLDQPAAERRAAA
ncbi:alpha/beta fold hydrolase [Sphingopyxis sp. DHUNG17]|uniref:alpha/beta fold hydrolase n=1 Tax=Sphingopyxis jiangsuensis TaxID=2871171 RepID=UPI00191CE4FF|nr:alpha/beta hydrolase [Sphingopyxis lutea]MBL0768162.1 alpha/beta fold hydrolase [Sphingopyxis lutea]